MPERAVLPYGSWPSPITVGMAVAGSLSIREPRLDGAEVYWTEGRPQEDGRQVIVRWRDGAMSDAIPAGHNARTMAHEYGGGAYAAAEGTVYFSNLADGRLYGQAGGGEPVPITAEELLRYGDIVFDVAHRRLICVVEDHIALAEATAQADGRVAEPVNFLAAIDPVGGSITRLAEGSDFYSTPRPSPDGKWLAWLSWRHPNMPWDGCELWLAEVDGEGRLREPRLIAGGAEESIVQPEWAPDGSLVFVSDRTGWWNLYRLERPADGERIRPLAPMKAEFAGPQWVFGLSWYAIDDDGTIFAIARRRGRNELWRVPADGDRPEQVEIGQTEMRDVQAGGGRVVLIGASPTKPQAVILLDPATGEQQVLRRTAELAIDPGYISAAQPISFPTSGGRKAHALYYPPTNADIAGPPRELPPLVVMSHGGPTSSAWGGLNLEKQLFTSRGFAVVDVDYGGSNGYGREYMRRLDGQWGIVDVDDCINAARHLAAEGRVDARRMAIRGGSAGGYTTLCALVFHDVFACGASHYGVGDLEALARDTHKFESHYLDRLVAPYVPGSDVYHDRSPIHYTERIDVPIIVLQGLDDRVVPPAQAEQLVEALRRRGIPHAYLPFAGEGHGFRRAENIARALEAELSFYAQVFGFTLADEVTPVELVVATQG